MISDDEFLQKYKQLDSYYRQLTIWKEWRRDPKDHRYSKETDREKAMQEQYAVLLRQMVDEAEDQKQLFCLLVHCPEGEYWDYCFERFLAFVTEQEYLWNAVTVWKGLDMISIPRRFLVLRRNAEIAKDFDQAMKAYEKARHKPLPKEKWIIPDSKSYWTVFNYLPNNREIRAVALEKMKQFACDPEQKRLLKEAERQFEVELD